MIRIYNANILNENFEIVSGEVITDGKFIKYVGGSSLECDFEREIDANGNLIIPGFKNCHTHSPMTLFRSAADDIELLPWLNDVIIPKELKMTDEDVYWGVNLAICEYLSSGITTCSDMYFHEDATASAIKNARFKDVLVSGSSDGKKDKDIALNRMERNFNKYNDGENLFYRLGFHSEYTTSKELRLGVAELSRKYHASVNTHISESYHEVQGCIQRYGCRPTELFLREGLLENGGTFYHCVHFNDDDIEIFKEKRLYVVTNSGSNLKLASGISPLSRYIENGITVAIGTDGAASNNALDFFREMYMTCVLQKVKFQDAKRLPADLILKMAVTDGAKVLGLKNNDSIKVGNIADLVLIDLSRPNMQPINNIKKNIVYSGNVSNVIMTMVNGNILYEKGNYYIGEDYDNIVRKCNQIVRRLL